ncbi:MAG: phosphatidate cytidylyltransferase [Acidimicrobiales bacterium]|jgi:phosphatidate cytidylyltransferase|nr:phosphatidate cytidylyltransferase [Acidimicrobiales bacterium]
MTPDDETPVDDGDAPAAPPEASEGVRLIAADEVDKVAERGGVAKRRRSDEPKYGDRPPAPPDDVRPTIRFPLPDASDPEGFERPRVAPVERQVAEGSVTPTPEAPPPAEPADVTRVILGDDQPVLDLGPGTGEALLPHWTEPPTGQVPLVVIGDEVPGGDDEEARWSSYAAGATRWRDEHDTSDHGDLLADLAEVDDEATAAGALDTAPRASDDAYLNFDDVDLGAGPPVAASRSRRRSTPPSEASAPGGPIDLSGRQPTAPPPPPPPLPEAPGERRGRAAAPRASRLPSTHPGPVDPAADPAAPRSRRPVPPSDDGGDGAARNVPQAVVAGLVIAVVALVAFAVGPAAAMVLVTVVVALAGAEYFAALQRGGFRPATLLGLVAVAILPVAAYWRGEAAVPLVMFLSLVVGVLWFILGVGGKARPTANLGVTLLGIVWVGVLGSFAALILDIPVEGVSILLLTVVAAVAADVGGFFVGRSIGRTPLTPTSPNKTVEGLLGGVVATLLAVFVVAVILGFGPFSAGQALVFALVAALVSPLGDLGESLLKRDLGLKDMGALIPQHGGVLDRFDGLLFVLPTAYYVTRYFGFAG